MNSITIFRAIGSVFKNCGGATGGQKSSLAADQAFQRVLATDYQTTFGQNQALFNNLTTGLQQITNAGASQTGFSPAELAAKNSQAINAAAAGNQKIQTAIGENAAAKGTADPGVESGIVQAERAAAETGVDTALTNQEANITEQNYATGRQNFWNATKGLEEAPGAFENPSSTAANAGSNANSVANQEANAIQQANQEGIDSTLGLIQGLASNAATAASGGAAGGAAAA